jgi:hypothetical protein
MTGFRSSPNYPGLGPQVGPRPTLYQAWAAGHRWVFCRGFLCRVSAIPGCPGVFWLAHLGSRKVKGCQYFGFVPMTELASPMKPNTATFLSYRRS